ncbi:MAG: D-alanyl-D-alanine carboxypeptidase family protein [Bacillota bacterium]
MLKKLFSIVVLFLSIFSFASGARAGEPEIVGEAAAVIDARTGKLLYGKEEHKRMYPASTTKVLTALVAMERARLDDVVTIGPNPITAGGTSMWFVEGERLTMEELLYALMLNSANDAGVAIAEHIAGSVENFAELSNKRAKEIGTGDTHFTNPHGMPDENHYSTAYDLALIGREAMKNKDLRKIVATIHHEVPRTDPEAQKYLFNHNKLLWSRIYGYKGATGVKTGYTVEAGQCIIASAERDGRELIAVVLRSEGSNLWTDAAKLLDYGFANYTNRQLIYGGNVMANLPVKYGKTKVDLVADEDFFYTFPKQGAGGVQVVTEPVKEISAPVNKGQVLGAVVIRSGQEELGRVDLVAAADVQRDWLALCQTFLKWVGPPLLFLVWIRRRVVLNRKKRKREARRRQYYNYGSE